MQRYAFMKGEWLDLNDAKIGVMTHAFLYGTACFEGIRAYWNEEEQRLMIFRMKEHYERLLRSCRILKIKSAYTADQLCELTTELLRRNNDKQDVYIRPIFYKASEAIGVKLSGLEDDFILFSVPFGAYLDLSKGLDVKVTSWRHLEDNMIPMRAKVNGAYVNAALAKDDALSDGYDEAIFLTSDGHVSEGSAENLFVVRDGKLITPPITSDLLEGITRSTIMELASEELGLDVVERTIDRTELYVCEEAFFVGTGAQVSPIASVDRRPLGDGKPGAISQRVQEIYFSAVRGQIEKYRHWCTPIGDAR